MLSLGKLAMGSASLSNPGKTASASNPGKTASASIDKVLDKTLDKVFEGDNFQKITNYTGHNFSTQQKLFTYGFFFIYTIIILSILVNDANQFRKKEEEKNYKKLLQLSLASLFVLGLFSIFKFMYEKQQFIPIKFLLYFCLPLCINIVIYFLILKYFFSSSVMVFQIARIFSESILVLILFICLIKPVLCIISELFFEK